MEFEICELCMKKEGRKSVGRQKADGILVNIETPLAEGQKTKSRNEASGRHVDNDSLDWLWLTLNEVSNV